jgi:hypothetical protein
MTFYVFLYTNSRDMMTIDQALNDIMQLDYTSREMLLEILQKRQIEARRDQIAENAEQAIKGFHAGNFIPMSAQDGIEHLRAL